MYPQLRKEPGIELTTLNVCRQETIFEHYPISERHRKKDSEEVN